MPAGRSKSKNKIKKWVLIGLSGFLVFYAVIALGGLKGLREQKKKIENLESKLKNAVDTIVVKEEYRKNNNLKK